MGYKYINPNIVADTMELLQEYKKKHHKIKRQWLTPAPESLWSKRLDTCEPPNVWAGK